jgi:hypothetical protein
VILDLQAALADISATSARLDSIDPAHTPDRLSDRESQQHNLHLYSLTRSASGALVLGHVSHSSHSSHSSGSGHYSHASHSSHTSHVSGAHSSHVSSVAPTPTPTPTPTPSPHAGAGSAKGRPDLRIGKVGGELIGNDIYGSAARQTVKQTGSAGRRLTWQISVQNDASVSDRIRLAGARSAHGFTVKYISATGIDVTKQVVGGKFRTPQLGAGASYRLKVVVTVTRNATRMQPLTAQLEASSVRTPARTDEVAFVARRG